jgi:hypothetical protein
MGEIDGLKVLRGLELTPTGDGKLTFNDGSGKKYTVDFSEKGRVKFAVGDADSVEIGEPSTVFDRLKKMGVKIKGDFKHEVAGIDIVAGKFNEESKRLSFEEDLKDMKKDIAPDLANKPETDKTVLDRILEFLFGKKELDEKDKKIIKQMQEMGALARGDDGKFSANVIGKGSEAEFLRKMEKMGVDVLNLNEDELSSKGKKEYAAYKKVREELREQFSKNKEGKSEDARKISEFQKAQRDMKLASELVKAAGFERFEDLKDALKKNPSKDSPEGQKLDIYRNLLKKNNLLSTKHSRNQSRDILFSLNDLNDKCRKAEGISTTSKHRPSVSAFSHAYVTNDKINEIFGEFAGTRDQEFKKTKLAKDALDNAWARKLALEGRAIVLAKVQEKMSPYMEAAKKAREIAVEVDRATEVNGLSALRTLKNKSPKGVLPTGAASGATAGKGGQQAAV